MENLIKEKIGFDCKKINQHLDFLRQGDIVYVAGSIIESCVSPYSENMGNRLSDIDIFIITSNYEAVAYNYIDECKKTFFLNFNEKNIDVEVYDKEKVFRLLDNMNKCDFSAEEYSLKLVEVDGVSFFEYASMLHRAFNGFAVYNEADFNTLRENANIDNYFRLLKRFAINAIDNAYDDVVGNLENMNYEVALFLSRNILVQTIKVYLFLNKISLDRDKWILFKLKNFAKKSPEAEMIQMRFNELYKCSLSSDDDIKRNVREILDFSNQIIVVATAEVGF